jgi:hypothetical protein
VSSSLADDKDNKVCEGNPSAGDSPFKRRAHTELLRRSESEVRR